MTVLYTPIFEVTTGIGESQVTIPANTLQSDMEYSVIANQIEAD